MTEVIPKCQFQDRSLGLPSLSASVDRFQAFEVTLQRVLLRAGEGQEFKAMVVSAAVADHRSHFPRKA
jgi:hypothetical protein